MTLPPQKHLTVVQLQSYYASLKAAGVKQQAAIAGGAVRDALNNRPVKDIDIYISTDTCWEDEPKQAQEEIENVIQVLKKLFYAPGKCLSTKEFDSVSEMRDRQGRKHEYEEQISVQEVWHWESGFNSMPCDVIFVDGDVIDTFQDGFDFGICQAWVGHYGLRASKAYWKDVVNRTMTYMLRQDRTVQYELSQRHLARMLEKYPGWKPRNICPAFVD